MNKKVIVLLTTLLISVFTGFSQGFSDYKMQTPYNDYFTDFIKVNDYYLITGFQVDQNASTTYSVLRNFITKVDNNGNLIQTIYADTFDSEDFYQKSCHYNNNIYIFGTKGVGSDSTTFCIWKRDTNLTLLSEHIFSEIELNYFFSTNSKINSNDSIISFYCNYYDSNAVFHSFLFDVNLNCLSVQNITVFNESFYMLDYIRNNTSNSFYAMATMFGDNIHNYNVIVKYDSNFNFIDTINLSFYPSGNSNIQFYQSNKYIFSSEGPDIWHITPNNPDFFDKLRLTIVDSNFNFISQISFGDIDSSDVRAGYGINLSKNSNNEYFAGAYLTEGLFNTSHPDLGLLIVKLDSNLTEIWHKNIIGNSRYRLHKIHPTDDGGVLLLVEKGPKNGSSADAFLMKIGPNGEVTNIIDLKIPNRKSIVSIFPNPTSQNLNIKLLETTQNIDEIRIYDLQFKEILNRKINSTQTTIEVNKLAKGVYLVEGETTKGEIFMEKFVVE